jgi:hypothetical protein
MILGKKANVVNTYICSLGFSLVVSVLHSSSALATAPGIKPAALPYITLAVLPFSFLSFSLCIMLRFMTMI